MVKITALIGQIEVPLIHQYYTLSEGLDIIFIEILMVKMNDTHISSTPLQINKVNELKKTGPSRELNSGLLHARQAP